MLGRFGKPGRTEMRSNHKEDPMFRTVEAEERHLVPLDPVKMAGSRRRRRWIYPAVALLALAGVGLMLRSNVSPSSREWADIYDARAEAIAEYHHNIRVTTPDTRAEAIAEYHHNIRVTTPDTRAEAIAEFHRISCAATAAGSDDCVVEP
jgi:hypothetical protein